MSRPFAAGIMNVMQMSPRISHVEFRLMMMLACRPEDGLYRVTELDLVRIGRMSPSEIQDATRLLAMRGYSMRRTTQGREVVIEWRPGVDQIGAFGVK